MTISPSILTDLASLQAQVAKASPLNKATHATITAIQLNASNLLKSVRSSLIAPDNELDTWSASSENILDIIAGLEGLVEAADDAQRLALMEGIVGRASTNLDQLT